MQKEDAARAIRNLRSVKGVKNRLTVAAVQADPDRLRKSIEQALERRADREAGKVRVTVDDGIVTLDGRVCTWPERTAVLGAVSHAPGVRAVRDRSDRRPLDLGTGSHAGPAFFGPPMRRPMRVPTELARVSSAVRVYPSRRIPRLPKKNAAATSDGHRALSRAETAGPRRCRCTVQEIASTTAIARISRRLRARCLAVAAGMMMSDPIRSTPRNRSPSETASANARRNRRLSLATSIPAVRARSGETKAMTRRSSASIGEGDHESRRAEPETISAFPGLPGDPNSASIRSSPERHAGFRRRGRPKRRHR